jgi:hypothetical protein
MTMTTMTMMMTMAAAAAIWDVTLHSLTDSYKRFRATCSLRLQDRWKQYILLSYLSTRLYCGTSQKAIKLIFNSVKTNFKITVIN